MSEAKHTPGPWDFEAVGANASGGFHLYLIDSAKRKIAAFWGGAEEKRANAFLVAAAPDLREAGQLVVDAFCGECESEDREFAMNKLIAALAKSGS